MNTAFRFLGVTSLVAAVLEQMLHGATLPGIYGMAFGCACLLIALTIFPKRVRDQARPSRNFDKQIVMPPQYEYPVRRWGEK